MAFLNVVHEFAQVGRALIAQVGVRIVSGPVQRAGCLPTPPVLRRKLDLARLVIVRLRVGDEFLVTEQVVGIGSVLEQLPVVPSGTLSVADHGPAWGYSDAVAAVAVAQGYVGYFALLVVQVIDVGSRVGQQVVACVVFFLAHFAANIIFISGVVVWRLRDTLPGKHLLVPVVCCLPYIATLRREAAIRPFLVFVPGCGNAVAYRLIFRVCALPIGGVLVCRKFSRLVIAESVRFVVRAHQLIAVWVVVALAELATRIAHAGHIDAIYAVTPPRLIEIAAMIDTRSSTAFVVHRAGGVTGANAALGVLLLVIIFGTPVLAPVDAGDVGQAGAGRRRGLAFVLLH